MKKLVLFDLNGTLVLRKGRSVSFRPGIETLRALTDLCVVGVYTSMQEENALRIVRQLRLKFPDVFTDDCVVLHRKHTTIIGHPNPWSSAKPIRKWFPEREVLLVDDGSHAKAMPEEIDLFVPIPSWSGDTTDTALETLFPRLVDKIAE